MCVGFNSMLLILLFLHHLKHIKVCLRKFSFSFDNFESDKSGISKMCIHVHSDYFSWHAAESVQSSLLILREQHSRRRKGRKWKVLNMKPIFSVQFSFMEEEGNIIKYT